VPGFDKRRRYCSVTAACSVGQLTHGMATPDDVRGNSDVVDLLNRPSPAGHGDVDIAAASEARCLVTRRPYTTGSTIDAKRAVNKADVTPKGQQYETILRPR
jgi:hypothetical protein